MQFLMPNHMIINTFALAYLYFFLTYQNINNNLADFKTYFDIAIPESKFFLS